MPVRVSSRLALAALGVAAAYLGWLALLFAFQRSLQYPGAGIPAAAEPPRIPGLEVRWLGLPFGRVETWFLPATGPEGRSAPAIVFAHGNGELMDGWPDELAPFRAMGAGVLLVEYPGYGRSAGSPTEDSITAAFVAAYDALAADPRVDASRIVVLGQSLGGGAACALLAKRPIAAAILQSTFTSARVFARRYLAPGFLVRDGFDNASALRAFPGPVLVLHGSRDPLIPPSEGRALAAAARRARFVAYDCGHDYWHPDRLPFWRDVEAFLREAGVLADRS